MHRSPVLAALAAILTSATLAFAQTEPPPTTPPPSPPPPAEESEGPAPGILSDAASGAYERRESLPSVNIYLPDGEASVRLRKLIRNVLFESQIDYEFVNGDISTFLRYKYYARNYTYRIGVFDSIEFPDITSSNDDQEFERVRGGLLLVGVPKDYDNRYFVLLQNDRLTFGDSCGGRTEESPLPPCVERPDSRKNNIYLKLGYQFGTQFDERMNAIVGEQRGRITPVLTAFREIGPQRTGIAAAVTQSMDVWTGDYQYTKLEAEALRRFDITSTSFVFSRLHVGSFVNSQMADPLPPPRDRNQDEVPDEIPTWEFHDIPQYELFRLGGREALRSISGNDTAIGKHEVHLTNELFVPIFRNRNYRTGALYWNTLYGIGYVGAGTVGFTTDDITNTKRLVVDAGIGSESAITYRDWDVYFTFIYAHPVRRPDEIDKGRGYRFSIRTVR